MRRNRNDERRRFSVRHVRKQLLLRRIIGAFPQKELNPDEMSCVVEWLDQLEKAIELQETRLGVKFAAE